MNAYRDIKKNRVTRSRAFKVTSLGLIILVLTLVLGLTSACNNKNEKKVGIILTSSHTALESARTGLLDHLPEEDSDTRINIKWVLRDAEGDMSIAKSTAEEFVKEQFDLIVSIATPASQKAVEAVQNTDIPVVFIAVTDPVEAGLVDNWDEPGGQVTGVCDIAAVEPQIDLLMEIIPETENLGVIYNPKEPNSKVQIAMLYDIAEKYRLTVVEATVDSTMNVPDAARSLVGEVDVIWVPTDNTAVAAFQSILNVCLGNYIPVFASDVDTVEEGAIGAYGTDYYVVGQQGRKIVLRILSGEEPADIPIQMVPVTKLAFNMQTAERMGITIPQELLDQATHIFE